MIDAFNDADVQQIAHTVRVENYPDNLVEAIERTGRDVPSEKPFAIYTGAVENHPSVVDAMAAHFTLLGNESETNRRVRDPFELQRTLSECGLPTVDVLASDQPPASGKWLRKPLKSAGGLGIVRHVTEHQRRCDGNEFILQEFIEGRPLSAVFISSINREFEDVNCQLLGVTRQLIGLAEVHASPFGYCGSIGPADISSAQLAIIQKLGSHIAATFRLRGLFNLDVIDDGSDFYVVEVNPRYPTSAEIIERTIGTSVVGQHVASCLEPRTTSANTSKAEPPKVNSSNSPPAGSAQHHGKLILYAKRSIEFPCDWNWSQFSSVADLPNPGTSIESSHPICTVFANGDTEEDCRQELVARAAELYAAFEEL